jgi:putative membrane protein
MEPETVIRKAEFNEWVCQYWLLSGCLILTVTIVGIVLLPFWVLIGLIVTRRYLARMECTLTDRALKIKKGMLVRVEKTVPLDKITDMGMVQGPIMRRFGLYTLTVETAGQSGQGALVSLTGIVDAKDFRETVLAQRELISALAVPVAPESSPQGSEADRIVLTEIRDALLRIEKKLKDKPVS